MLSNSHSVKFCTVTKYKQQADRQTDRQTDNSANETTAMWGSLRLVPISPAPTCNRHMQPHSLIFTPPLQKPFLPILGPGLRSMSPAHSSRSLSHTPLFPLCIGGRVQAAGDVSTICYMRIYIYILFPLPLFAFILAANLCMHSEQGVADESSEPAI